MAARLNKLHQANVREKIKTSMHLTSLHKNAIGEMEMDAIQQKSAIFLVEQSIGKAPLSVAMDVEGGIEITVANYADQPAK